MQKNTDLSITNTKYAMAAFFSVVVFVITYKYSLNLVSSPDLNDLREHTLHAQNIYLDTLGSSWLERPYLLWHLSVKGFIKFFHYPVNEAAACVCAFYAAFSYYIAFIIVNKLGDKLTGHNTGFLSASVSCALSFVMPYYLHWFNSYQYEGQFSINPFFNPTHMAVKPFGLLCFLFALDLISIYKEQSPIFFKAKWYQKYLYVLFSITLLFSAFAKPTFMYMLLPAGVIYLLIDFFVNLRKKDDSHKKTWNFMWKIACACIPALLYLLIEYAAFYFWGGTNSDASIAIYPFLYAWHAYSPNIPKSILLSMAFPIWMVLSNLKYFLTSIEGRLSVLGYAVGFLEFAFFVETGNKLHHLNFAWPMMAGMLLIWVISGVRLVVLTYSNKTGVRNTITLSIGWILLLFHLFSGLYFISPTQYVI